MSDAKTLTIENWIDRVATILASNKTDPEVATQVATALVLAERDGQAGHGLSRVASYAAQAKSGKVMGFVKPSLERVKTGAARIDAKHGFAYPALNMACDWLIETSKATGIACAGVYNSHHAGQAGQQVERLAEAGLVSLMFANSPSAIAPWGGKRALFGTNPVAFGAPRTNGDPLVIDMSLAKVARGKIMAAAKEDRSIPLGWALDADGKETTDAKAALKGLSLPMGDAKGYPLVLMVEILAAALVGACFGFEASSFFEGEGNPPSVGQLIIAIDPNSMSGGDFAQRVEELLMAIEEQEGARLPGASRLTSRKLVAENGLSPTQAIRDELDRLESNS
ncbi:MAG: Ldh family oxidoreductase [Alphaproteobacteria bacterium]